MVLSFLNFRFFRSEKPSPGGSRLVPANQELPRKKEKPVIVSAACSIVGSYSEATSIKFDPHVSGGAYQNVRKVTTEWNARSKHWCSPEFRGRKHQTRPGTLFSPIFSLAREKMGPPEARQKRPRRNESLQARLLILCARFFLSKPQTKFAVWVFLCKSATTPQSRLRRASIPTPFVPSGHFPLIGGIGPWEGSLFQRQIIWKRASLVASASGWNWTPSI